MFLQILSVMLAHDSYSNSLHHKFYLFLLYQRHTEVQI